VQCKRQADAVGNGAVQAITAAKPLYRCDEAWVVTNSRFTRSAVELARANKVTLIEGKELDRLGENLLEASRPPVNGRLFEM
jgi:restriction system protein